MHQRHVSSLMQNLDSDAPMDIQDQDLIIQQLDRQHRASSRQFATAYSSVAVLIFLLFMYFAWSDERYHFNEASGVVSMLSSLSSAGVALACCFRMHAPDVAGYDLSGELRRRAHTTYTTVAGVLCLWPTLLHLMLTMTELYRSYIYEAEGPTGSVRSFLSHVSPHHLLFLWPFTYVVLTEYSASLIRQGYQDVHDLRKTRYEFKAL